MTPVGLEPTLPKEPDLKSDASTYSAMESIDHGGIVELISNL